jgi:hypothetical protein
MFAPSRPGQQHDPNEPRAVWASPWAGNATAPSAQGPQKAVLENPEFAGDIEKLALEALLTAVAGGDKSAKQAIRRQYEQLESQLGGWFLPPWLLPLARRVAMLWIEVYHADLQLAMALKELPSESPKLIAAERRATFSHRRHLAAILALERARSLAGPPKFPK